MSLLTKRERGFNEHELFELPSRNEGKLKAYASCTDARAWSHFCSDKSEHLVEIIKRNNETCRPKYLPTDVIVNTLMISKNAEISRLKRKIEEFEQMLAAYDQLELTCDQKCDIANAHAAIKAANKELDEMCLDLDLSGFTEGTDSERYETGKSRGDETIRSTAETGKSRGDESWDFAKAHVKFLESKSNQMGGGEILSTCDASTCAYDTRIDELQESIIRKDAKLSAMQNKIAVMEFDVCEPFCIYAHIYTALVKIFETLCQNGKYKEYLYLLTAGKDTRSIDIKGKILFKMKVLEKFCLALIAPCSQDDHIIPMTNECSCYRAEVITTFALTSAECDKNNSDDRRAQLVADIIDNQEMQEILNKDSNILKDITQCEDDFVIEANSSETESINRLKNLQANYDELVICYDNLKFEKDCLFLRCQKYSELEKECECMQNQLRQYNQLWNDKEFYRKRSEDLDALKERYYILAEETSNMETKLKAEAEINKIKNNNIQQLQNENVALEKKLYEATITFEKEKNNLTCKLKEYECKIICQEQQIKTLTLQIDKLIERGLDETSPEDTTRSMELLNEIETQKEQIKNLQRALLCNEEEKQVIQNNFEDKLQIIHELKMDLDNWKEKYNKIVQENFCLEEFAADHQNQIQILKDQNKLLYEEVENKRAALDSLKLIIHSKSKEINSLTDVIHSKEVDNQKLLHEIKTNKEEYSESLESFKNDNMTAISNLKSSQQESHEILNTLRHYLYDDNRKLSSDKIDQCILPQDSENYGNSDLLNEINKLHETSMHRLHLLLDENQHYKQNLDISKKESEALENKLRNLEKITNEFKVLKLSYEKLLNEKSALETELQLKNNELNDLKNSFKLTKKESEELNKRIYESENLKEEFQKISLLYKKLINERIMLQNELKYKQNLLESIETKLGQCEKEKEEILDENKRLWAEQKKTLLLEKNCDFLLDAKNALEKDLETKTQEFDDIYKELQAKAEENQNLLSKVETLCKKEEETQKDILSIQNDNLNVKNCLMIMKKESQELLEKLRAQEEGLKADYNNLKSKYEENISENNKIRNDYKELEKLMLKLSEENKLLNEQKNDLLAHSEDLEQALINARVALNDDSKSSPKDFLDGIKSEIDRMKKEKMVNHKKIRELMDKLDESELLISNLQEDILAKDSKIATLQNYINDLQEEVGRLNNNIALAVESSEQLLSSNNKRMDDSLRMLDAHHSKTTEVMKQELSNLNNEKYYLKNELSSTKLKSEENLRENRKYLEQLTDLYNERRITMQNIKDLEILCCHNSSLCIDACNLDDIVTSLNNIRHCIDAKQSKNISLEQTLLTVQNSSKVLLSKADEAKRIAENEKQKIIAEKEQAIREKIGMEKQLSILESKLREQITKDQEIIKDLDAKLLNQKLMFEKIDEVRQNFISKLEKEVQNFQDLYENSLSKIRELQGKAHYLSEENSKKIEEIETVTKNLEKKTKEVSFLRKCIDELKNKPQQCIGTQTKIFKETLDFTCQFTLQEERLNKEVNTDYCDNLENNFKPNRRDSNIDYDYSHLKEDKLLNASNLELVKRTYLRYKIKQLSPTILEQCTISCTNRDFSNDDKDVTRIQAEIATESKKQNILSDIGNHHKIIDIYNTHSVFTHNTEFSSKSPEVESTLELSNENFENKPVSVKGSEHKSKIYECSSPSTNNDLFLIYKDSDGDSNAKESWTNQQCDTNVTNKSLIPVPMILKTNDVIQEGLQENSHLGSFYTQDEDSVKAKLTLSLPRVGLDSISRETNSECDNKSIDSYTVAIYASPATTSDIKIDNISHDDEKPPETHKKFNTNNSILKTCTEFTESQHLPIVKAKTVKISNYKDETGLEKASLRTSMNKPIKSSAQKKINDHGNFNRKKNIFNSNNGLKYILDSVKNEIDIKNLKINSESTRKSLSDNNLFQTYVNNGNGSRSYSSLLNKSSNNTENVNVMNGQSTFSIEQGVMAKLDNTQEYESKIKELTKALENIEKHYKRKIEAVKMQYDNNIKNIINEHNQGVESIQSLHEDTLKDVIRSHEGEIENLRSMSIEAMRKVDKLERENKSLKLKLQMQNDTNDMKEEPIKITDARKRKYRRSDTKMLTTTNIEAFNVRPKQRSHGPCTCTLDSNISDTIRTIFEQVDVDQRRMAEYAYTKYIANKIINNTVEALDAQELAFLHLKVCRTWKSMLSEEEVLQRRIDSLESELMSKQRQTKKHIADLDRKVAEERRRLEEVREAVCRNEPSNSRDNSPTYPPPEKDVCECSPPSCSVKVAERMSAGDLAISHGATTLRPRKFKQESNRAVSAKLDQEARKDKKHYHDEQPIRLRRSHDRANKHLQKK